MPTPAEALAPLADALRADGYELRVIEDGDEPRRRLRLEVVPTDDACADCLVPPALMADMARDRLRAAGGGPWDIDVRYPGYDGGHDTGTGTAGAHTA